MVVDRFVVLHFDLVALDPIVLVECDRYLAHHILNEPWVVVSLLRNELLVRALQYRIKRRRSRAFDGINQTLDL